ncbi:MAG: hypothetical protein GX045_01035 [Clostridiaceae bacterium]|nr:hypothetical protein [Clostridiaceae bacterium]
MANNKIINSINEISAVSEETVANVEEADALTSENLNEANFVKELVSELICVSEKMDKYQ